MISPATFARYAAMHVPRYTSYPTAPNFSPAIDSLLYRSWLRALPRDEQISLYLHTPFCREMCWYCGCHTTVARRRAPVSRYNDSLLRELEMVARAIDTRLTVGHLHLGGGSPTLLARDDLDKLRRRLNAHFDFTGAAELAVEIDPRTLTADLAKAFAAFGINRASLGVQSFDPTVQRAINRIQSFELTAAAIDQLRSNGIAAINLDLIYGLPFQTVQSCVETVEQALRLEPERLAVFGYAHVPSFKAHQRKLDESALPSARERGEQAGAIAERLVAAGFERIGLDHFARTGDSLALAASAGTLHRNFQGYTADPCRTLIGLGASAIGRLPQGFVQNAARIPEYERRIAAGGLATVRGCGLSADDRKRGEVIEALMCNYRARLGGLDAPLGSLEADGLIRRSGDLIEVVDEARPLIRTVAAAFDSYLPGSTAQHAVAV